MTLPTGTISMSNINTEVGAAAGATRDMAWVRANTKIAANNLGAVRGFAWFQLNGPLTNPYPRTSNCSNCNCSNCVGAQCRDARAWLQANCNCNCTGNCNCQCNCLCKCT